MLSDLDLRSRIVTKHPLPCTQKQSVGKLVKRREIYFRQVTVMPLEMDLIPLTEKNQHCMGNHRIYEDGLTG